MTNAQPSTFMNHKKQTQPQLSLAVSCGAKLLAVLVLLVGVKVNVAAAAEQEIKIGTLHGKMRYDVESFQVKPGTKVRLTLKNTDEMQHNLLILTPGENKAMEVAQKAWALGEEAVKKAFVPDVPDVLFHTKVVDPQQSDTITFVAPDKEADYPYRLHVAGARLLDERRDAGEQDAGASRESDRGQG